MIALGAEFIRELIIAYPVIGLTVAVVIIGILSLLYLVYRKKMKQTTGSQEQ